MQATGKATRRLTCVKIRQKRNLWLRRCVRALSSPVLVCAPASDLGFSAVYRDPLRGETRNAVSLQITSKRTEDYTGNSSSQQSVHFIVTSDLALIRTTWKHRVGYKEFFKLA